MARFNKKCNCTEFGYSKLTKTIKEHYLWYRLEIDGDVFWCRNYPNAMRTLFEILSRDCLPKF